MRYLCLGLLLTCWIPVIAEPLTVTASLRVRPRGFRLQASGVPSLAVRWQETRRDRVWMVVVQSPGEPVRSWGRGPQDAPYGEMSLRSPSKDTVVTFLTLPDSPVTK
jgi:hypothetical protein